MRDGKTGAAASGQLTGVARAQSPTDKHGDGLAQRLMGIPGDRDRLGMKIVGDIDCGSHGAILASFHHDVMMQNLGQLTRIADLVRR